jgi:hypothetical protein
VKKVALRLTFAPNRKCRIHRIGRAFSSLSQEAAASNLPKSSPLVGSFWPSALKPSA